MRLGKPAVSWSRVAELASRGGTELEGNGSMGGCGHRVSGAAQHGHHIPNSRHHNMFQQHNGLTGSKMHQMVRTIGTLENTATACPAPLTMFDNVGQFHFAHNRLLKIMGPNLSFNLEFQHTA